VQVKASAFVLIHSGAGREAREQRQGAKSRDNRKLEAREHSEVTKQRAQAVEWRQESREHQCVVSHVHLLKK
jgi:hypothetical protein